MLRLANEKGFELGFFNHEIHLETRTQLDSYDLKLDCYEMSLENLMKRLKGIFSLVCFIFCALCYLDRIIKMILTVTQVSSGLNIKNQRIAAEMNEHMLKLTEDTVDDSSTVRVVTLVTLVYLPSSYVGVSGSQARANYGYSIYSIC